jgi:hypothetical protein
MALSTWAARSCSPPAARSSGRNDSRGGLVLLGLGVFFGRLIMAAVSRQREYLG